MTENMILRRHVSPFAKKNKNITTLTKHNS